MCPTAHVARVVFLLDPVGPGGGVLGSSRGHGQCTQGLGSYGKGIVTQRAQPSWAHFAYG